MKIKDITNTIRFTDQIYGSGHENVPVISFPRGNRKHTTYSKTALNRIAWESDYIAQYVPLSTPNPEAQERYGGRICSLVSVYHKEGNTSDFVTEEAWNYYNLERWPDAIMLREVFRLVNPPKLTDVYDDAIKLTYARGRLGEPSKQLYERLAEEEIYPVHNLYRSEVALEYLSMIAATPSKQIVANRRTGRAGYVYALSLPEYPNKLKIGSAFDVSMRISGLSTSVPVDFIHSHSHFFDDCRTAEVEIQKYLAHARIRKDREWFTCSLEQFHDAIYNVEKKSQK